MTKKLIEVALPMEAINKASAYEKMPGIGPHPRGLHLWWARRPLVAARAVIFSQMVDDPSSHPELFPIEADQERERQRLFRLIEELVKWENTTNEELLEQAREEIRKSWFLTCADHADHPQATELFNPDKLPAFHDPFAGGGALPLEAQRLGLKAYASDLNPVAVLINKAMIEIPPKFAGRLPVNPKVQKDRNLFNRGWSGAQGLAEDVRYYGQWMRDEAEKRIGHLYPPIEITRELIEDPVNPRPDLKKYLGKKLTVIAWLWARTVKSPNPAFAGVDVPLASSFMLSTKKGKEAYVEPLIEGDGYRFLVKVGKPEDVEVAKRGTKLSRGANFKCLMSGTPIGDKYIKAESMARQMGVRLMAIVAEGEHGRVYLAPTLKQEAVARQAVPDWKPDQEMNRDTRDLVSGRGYGFFTWADLFTPRQLTALTTFADLVGEARTKIETDARVAGMGNDNQSLNDGGTGAKAYAEAVAVYLGFGVERCADFSNSCTRWVSGNQKVMNLFGKQAIAMTWDFPEAAILHKTVGGFTPATDFIAKCISKLPVIGEGVSTHCDATTSMLTNDKVVSTDPPYYDNIGYADLSDFFYVWMRRFQRSVFPDLFATMTVPKTEELVAIPYRHGSKQKAEKFFLDGMTQAMHRLAEQSHPAFPVTIYYAFKQSERKGDGGVASTGWETFLEAIIEAGFAISGTWPLRSEQQYRMIGIGTNALASSIIIVCRQRSATATVATRREFISALKDELPIAFHYLKAGNIAPVDLAQAAIGPGMAIYTRFARVVDAEGNALTVRDALTLINQVLDDVLAEQEGDLDADTRWALAWFEQFGFSPGDFGIAETLSKAKNTSVGGLVEAGILLSQGGKVRLLRPKELPVDWDPQTDQRLTVWEMVHHLIRMLAAGETAAAKLAATLGSQAEVARDLAYRLYNLCERQHWSGEALAYNGLVQSWPEIKRLIQELKTTASKPKPQHDQKMDY